MPFPPVLEVIFIHLAGPIVVFYPPTPLHPEQFYFFVGSGFHDKAIYHPTREAVDFFLY